jgi:hypothetical protein
LAHPIPKAGSATTSGRCNGGLERGVYQPIFYGRRSKKKGREKGSGPSADDNRRDEGDGTTAPPLPVLRAGVAVPLDRGGAGRRTSRSLS